MILVNLLVLAADMLIPQGSGECAACLPRLMYTDHHFVESVTPLSLLLLLLLLSNQMASCSLHPYRIRR